MNYLYKVGSVEEALSGAISAEEFRTKYGRDRLTCDQEIIFTCKTGRRAGVAAETTVKLGYAK